jgi:hypothetical protein
MGGELAFQFGLPAGMTSSSGFLKLFVATHYLNLDWIEQKTPFDANFDHTDRPDTVREDFVQQDTWDTLTVAVTMRRNILTAASDVLKLSGKTSHRTT